MVAASPKILTPYKEKDPSDKHIRMAKWIKQNGGGEIDPKAIQIVLAADGKFQKSEENQGFLSSRREQIELEKQAAEERRQQRAERKEAREAAAAEKAANPKPTTKSATPPVKKAPVKTAAKAAPAKAPATKAPTKAPAGKAAPKRPTPRGKAAAAAGGDFDSSDF